MVDGQTRLLATIPLDEWIRPQCGYFSEGAPPAPYAFLSHQSDSVVAQLCTVKGRRSSAVAPRRIARELQDWRFESDTLTSTAEIRLRAQQNGEARAALETALDIARRTGMAHRGSITLADHARTETRSKIIDEIEELLSTVAVSHNHWFERRQLIELGWELRDRRDERVVSRLSPRARLPFRLARSRLARTLAPNLHRRKDLGQAAQESRVTKR